MDPNCIGDEGAEVLARFMASAALVAAPHQGLEARVAPDVNSIGAEGAEVLARCMASAAPVADPNSGFRN